MSYGTVQAEKVTTESGFSLGAGNASSFKNRIINGAMVFDQRNAGASTSVDGVNKYTLDRWQVEDATDGVLSVQQVADAPSGFVNSLKVTVTTADASIGASQVALVRQRIEGYNFSDMDWGSANAKTITLSFWVKSSLTGTFGGAFLNSAANRSYPYSYTINTANTWEYKTVTVTGDLTGTWLKDNGIAVQVDWSLSAGSTYTNTGGSWYGALYLGVTGETQLMSTLNATWQITGAQLEVGTVATSFDFRSYGTELALCQRYYTQFGTTSAYEHFGIGVVQSGQSTTIMNLPVTMRAAPTFGYVGSLSNFVVYDGSSASTPTGLSIDVAAPNVCSLSVVAGSLTIGRATRFYRLASGLATLTYSAEL